MCIKRHRMFYGHPFLPGNLNEGAIYQKNLNETDSLSFS